ncbi:MAG TPA: chalcone isomerase family protein [Vicinamibacterales bacterium]|nr:chalcone isomerase family protein [Vicinamibacterales bacterium]
MMRAGRSLCWLLLVAGLAVTAFPARAATLAGVTLPDTTDVGGRTLVLNGLGLRTKFFIKVYVGGLYLPHRQQSPAAVTQADEPRRMLSQFLYGVSKGQMCDAWQEGLEDNTPNPPAEVQRNFAQLCAWMEPVPKGHTMVLTYVPGKGIEVELNGQVKGTLPGKATADAILATWIGPKPGPGQKFKNAVLGR